MLPALASQNADNVIQLRDIEYISPGRLQYVRLFSEYIIIRKSSFSSINQQTAPLRL